MKKLSYLLSLYAIAVLALLSSCGKDDEPVPPPTINFIGGTGFTSSDVTVAPGTTIMVGVVVTKGDKELKSYTVSVDGNTIAAESIADLPNNMENGFQDTIMIAVPAARATPYVYTFSVTSKDDQVASKSISVTSKEAGASLSYENSAAVLNNKLGTNPGAFNLVTNTTEASSLTSDMQNPSDLTNPWVKGWVAETTTRFVKAASTFDYNNANAEAAATAYAGGAELSTVNNVAVGDMYIAKLRGTNEYAVIKITGVDNDIANSNAEKITFSYKKTSATAGQ